MAWFNVDGAARWLLKVVSSKWFLWITFAWFVFQAIYFAVTVRYGLPPDENYHYSYIQLFAKHFPSPFINNQNGYDVLIEVVHNPFFLYHWLLSLPYWFVRHWDHAYVLLRMVNVALGVGSLWLAYKLSRLAKLSPLMQNLTIFMLANTMMFVFMASAISYDNLFIFLSLAGVYLLLKLYARLSATNLLLLAIVLLAGVMVKINFLPIAFSLFVLFLWRYGRQLSKVWKILRRGFGQAKYLNIGLTVVAILLAGLFIQRYGSNLVSYHRIEPACQRVRPIADCRKSSLFVRNEQVSAPGHPAASLNPLKYTVRWGKYMEQRTYAVYAHERFSPDRYIQVWISLVAVLSLAALVKYRRLIDRTILVLIIVSGFYLIILLGEGYSNYRGTGIAQLAIHGRYAFGVLPLLYIVSNRFVDRLLSSVKLKSAYVTTTLVIFFLACFPTYLHKITPAWREHIEPPSLSLTSVSPPAAERK